jgi:hypothetical protein
MLCCGAVFHKTPAYSKVQALPVQVLWLNLNPLHGTLQQHLKLKLIILPPLAPDGEDGLFLLFIFLKLIFFRALISGKESLLLILPFLTIHLKFTCFGLSILLMSPYKFGQCWFCLPRSNTIVRYRQFKIFFYEIDNYILL